MTEMSFIPMGTLVFLGYESDLVCVCGGGGSYKYLQLAFMILKLYRLYKWFSTTWTKVWFLSSVNFHMGIQATWLCERLGTFWTPMGFLSCVNIHMGFHIAWMAEWLATFRTTVRFISCMNYHVGFQITSLAEWLGTF